MEAFPWICFAMAVVFASIRLLYPGALIGQKALLLKPLAVTWLAVAGYLAGAPAFLTLALFIASLASFAQALPGRAAQLYAVSATGLVPIVLLLLCRSLGALPPWEAFAVMPLPAVLCLAAVLSIEIWLIPHAPAWPWPLRGYAGLVGFLILATLTLPQTIAGLAIVGLAAVCFAGHAVLWAIAYARTSVGTSLHFRLLELSWGFYFAALAAFFVGAGGL